MSEVLRTVRLEEAEEFERFLERCFGHGRGFFSRHHPDLARAHEDVVDRYVVLELDGEIVSHVGTHPMEIVLGPARVRCGGIGGVATLPKCRGKGYMGRLLEDSIVRMRDKGMPLSALWGDQQRYGSYGWEKCGVAYTLGLNRRSLGWNKVEAAEVREIDPGGDEALDIVALLHPTLDYRVERPFLPLQLKRTGIRMFVGPDGYLIAGGDTGGDLRVQEVVSPTEREPELILGAMDIVYAGTAYVEMGPCEGGRTDRLTAVMNWWNSHDQAMFRIIDWPALLKAVAPVLAEAAKRTELAPFRAVYTCRWGEDVEHAAVEWDGSALRAEKASAPGEYAMDERLLVAAMLGGPQRGRGQLGPLGRLLPLPLHIPAMDRV